MPENAVATVDGEQVTYKEATEKGIKAFAWTLDGVTYDTAPVEVAVTVEHVAENATVVASATYTKDGEALDQAMFSNVYTALVQPSDPGDTTDKTDNTEKKPVKGNLPQTGDISVVATAAVAAAGAVAAGAGAAIKRRRK